MKDKLLFLTCLIVMVLALFVRFYDLTIDPFNTNTYGVYWDDEGIYAQNARNKALFGNWYLEGNHYNAMFISPTLTYIEYFVFNILGISTISIRIIPATLGVLSIILVTLMLRKDIKLSVMYFIMLSTNVLLVAFQRISVAESVMIFFILIMLGLIFINTKTSWLITGLLTPFLFFSKFSSLYFVLAIPLSLILYYLLYKNNKTIIYLLFFCLGAIITSIAWLFWFIPNFSFWYFTNISSFSNLLGPKIIKTIINLSFGLKLLILQELSVILSVFYFLLLIKKLTLRKIEYLDLFILVVVVLFILQNIWSDGPLRRLVTLLPIILFMAARLINKLDKIQININNKKSTIIKSKIITFFLILYLVPNLIHLGLYFGRTIIDYDHTHMYYEASKQIKNIIPAGEKVYGSTAVGLSLENDIRPYWSRFRMPIFNTDNKMMPLFENKTINYAILRYNIFEETDINLMGHWAKSKILPYMQKNFKIVTVLNGKDYYSRSLETNFYIYKRK